MVFHAAIGGRDKALGWQEAQCSADAFGDYGCCLGLRIIQIDDAEQHGFRREVGEDALLRHDSTAKDPGLAFALSRLSNPRTLTNTPIGVFRDIPRPSYDRLVREQLSEVVAAKGAGDLQSLLTGGDTWNVS